MNLEQHSGEQAREVLLKQLDLLNDQMKDTAAEANSFLAKYLFGGLIAVIALLNVDLVLLKEPILAQCSAALGWAVILVLLLSGTYFYIVTNHYLVFRKSHRKLKYKFELTLHTLLLGGSGVAEDYSRRLEYSAGEEPRTSKPEYPESGNSGEVLDYLLDHHRVRLREIEPALKSPLFWLAMLLVGLTMIVRLLPIVEQGCSQ